MPDEVPMRFFLEETSFELPLALDIAAIEKCLEAFVALMRARHDQDHDIFRWSKLDEIEVRPGTPFCDLLYQEVASLPIDRDLRSALRDAINRCVLWDDRIEHAPHPLVDIAGVACTSPTGAVVHALLAAQHGAACLSPGLRPERAGAVSLRAGAVTHEVHFLTHESQLPLFYRTLFEVEDLQRDAYMENALDAFPEIAFVTGLSAQLGGFETSYRELRPILTSHLAVLNDHFPAVFKRHGGKTFETTKEIGAAYHVDATPESSTTHTDKKAMKQRDVVIESVLLGRRRLAVKKTISCEWHTKIKPRTDRLHFHPGMDDVAGGKLIVGRFVNHLK